MDARLMFIKILFDSLVCSIRERFGLFRKRESFYLTLEFLISASF